MLNNFSHALQFLSRCCARAPASGFAEDTVQSRDCAFPHGELTAGRRLTQILFFARAWFGEDLFLEEKGPHYIFVE